MDGNGYFLNLLLLFYILPRRKKHSRSASVHLSLPHPEADFVGSTLVRESLDSSSADDDKIYFFFTERSQEQTTTYSHSRVARVARVCKVSAALEQRHHSRCRVNSRLIIDQGAIIVERMHV